MSADPDRIQVAIDKAVRNAKLMLETFYEGSPFAASAIQVLRSAVPDQRHLAAARVLLAESGPDVDIRECEIAAGVLLEGLAERYGVPRDDDIPLVTPAGVVIPDRR